MIDKIKILQEEEKALQLLKQGIRWSISYTEFKYKKKHYGCLPFSKHLNEFLKMNTNMRTLFQRQETTVSFIVPPKMGIFLLGWKASKKWMDTHVRFERNDVTKAEINASYIYQYPCNIFFVPCVKHDEGGWMGFENEKLSFVTIVPNELNIDEVNESIIPILYLIAPQKFIENEKERIKMEEENEMKKIKTRIDFIEL